MFWFMPFLRITLTAIRSQRSNLLKGYLPEEMFHFSALPQQGHLDIIQFIIKLNTDIFYFFIFINLSHLQAHTEDTIQTNNPKNNYKKLTCRTSIKVSTINTNNNNKL